MFFFYMARCYMLYSWGNVLFYNYTTGTMVLFVWYIYTY